MVEFQSLISGLARSVSVKKKDIDLELEHARGLAREAKKNGLWVSFFGTVRGRGDNFASIYTKRGEKGINQDRVVVWEEFGCHKDMIFCGVFDGHGSWGHMVSRRVKKIMPASLLCYWQEAVALNSINSKNEKNDIFSRFEIWKQVFLKTCSFMDHDLEQHPRIDTFESGTTALTMVKQGDHLVIANIGDSRAVLATISEEGNLVPIQLTVDLKPNLPQETARITQSMGRVHSLEDEPGIYRIYGDSVNSPGLAISRAFGDHYIKGFGLISEPEITERKISPTDQFAILATDGVWDVISNQEAVNIVSLSPGREESAKRLVEHAVRAWKRKRPGIAVDDISAICLFFHSPHLRSNDDSTKNTDTQTNCKQI